jgi:hypothetical protein
LDDQCSLKSRQRLRGQGGGPLLYMEPTGAVLPDGIITLREQAVREVQLSLTFDYDQHQSLESEFVKSKLKFRKSGIIVIICKHGNLN